jgi:hypothetical protein
MSDPPGSWIPGLDPLTGAMTLPLWAAGALAALFVVFGVLAFSRAGRESVADTVGRVVLILVGAVFTWSFLQGVARQDAAGERRALEARAGALAARATTPGSPLACLDALAGDAVEQSCERTLFATPESMASAVSYVATQLSLFADVSQFVKRGDAKLEPLLTSLRRAVETDRYGLVAHVLATRDGCTAQRCPALATMRDPGRVSINLAQRTYDSYVIRHSSVWPAPAPTADVSPAPAAVPGTPALPQGATAVASPGAPRPAVRNGELFFPSSETIPPVNIMTAEPPAPSETTGSAPARTPPKRPARAAPPAQ